MTPGERVRLELLEDFKKSALERIERVTACWLALEQASTPSARPDLLLRELHTLKGEAKLMSFPAISRLVHTIEEVVVRFSPSGQAPPAELAGLVLTGLDLVVAIVNDAEGEAGPAGQRVNEHIARFAAQLKGAVEPPPAPARAPARAEPAPPRERAPGGETLRVDARLARNFAEACAEAVVAHARYQHRLAAAREIAARVGNPELSALLDALEEDVHVGSVHAREMDTTARRLRLVPLAPLFRLHARAVRDLASEHGKRASLDVVENDVSIDRAVLDRVNEPLLHLLRNGVDHGLELPAERRAAGKPEAGRIRLSAQAVGGEVVIEVEDDGAGIDLAVIRRRAVELGLPADGLSEADTLGLLFAPGFSTRRVASETSGRGVGLDVVKRQVESLGGSVRVFTRPGLGSRFELRVPLSVSLTRALVVRHGGVRYAIPTSAVQAVVLVEDHAIAQVHTRRTLSVGGERIALVDLGGALATTALTAAGRAVVVRHEGQAAALEVDEVEGHVEVVVKPLGGPLAGTRVVLGAGQLGDGELVLVLSPSELLTRALGELPRVRLAAARSPRGRGEQRVLLAEDSAITRSMMSRLLRMLGYQVREAEDGERALRLFEENEVDLVITDIEMPHMDGIELIERVRAQSRGKRLAVIVLSTRGSDEDKARALRAGADAYLVKTEFSEQALRDVLARHVELA